MEGLGFEVAPGLHRVEGLLGERIVACYLLVGDDAALLVDTGVDGTPGDSILPYARDIGLAPEQISWIVVTHCDVDHMGGNAAARQLFPAARFVAHGGDVELMENVGRIVGERYSEFAEQHAIDIDDEMKAWCHKVARATHIDLSVSGFGETIRLGPGRKVQLVATPGHSPGSLSVWDPRNRAAIVGDAILGSTIRRSDGQPAFPPTYRDVRDYRLTLTRIELLHPEHLLTSHDPVMKGEAVRAFFAETRSFAERLELEVLDELSGGDERTTSELIDILAPRVGEWGQPAWPLLAHALVGHLEDFEDAKLVARSSARDGIVRWRARG
ncbi:hypothetical protein BH24CHL6_BH24CHL6_03740 [soil metagenome]